MKQESQVLKCVGAVFEICRKIIHAIHDLGGDEKSFLKILSNDRLIGELADVLVGNAEIRLIVPTWKVWKKIRIGPLQANMPIQKVLTEKGFGLGKAVTHFLPPISFPVQEKEINLVLVSVGQLGLKVGAEYGRICERAEQLGLELCPSETGPLLRLQYPDQPIGTYFKVAMVGMTDPGLRGPGNHWIFELGVTEDDEKYLDVNNGSHSNFWHHDEFFVFKLPDSKS